MAVPTCLSRNPWCPVGYVCQRQPTGTSGQFEDTCVLQQWQRPVRTSPMLSRLQLVGSGRSRSRSRQSPSGDLEQSSPSMHSNFPNRNGNNTQRQVIQDFQIPLTRGQDIQSSRSGNIRRLDHSDIVREQSLDGIRPDLVKKNGIQRQSLTRNPSFDSTSVSDSNQDINISEATSPFREMNSTVSHQSDRPNIRSNTHECIPCTKHSDCNDIFTYCINKTPCVGQVCFKVT